MSSFQTSDHWQFAKAWAIHGLEAIILHFDFDKETRHHAYAGVMPPDVLLRTIDSFLAESDEVIFGGERTTLLNLRHLVTEILIPAYELGAKLARENFHNSNKQYGESLPEEVKNIAYQLAPSSEIARNWFVQAYCWAWAEEEVKLLHHQSLIEDSLQSE